MATTGDIALGGQGSFLCRIAGRPDFQSVVPLGSPKSSPCLVPFPAAANSVILIPFDDTMGQFTTSIAIANTTASAQNISIEFDDAANNPSAQRRSCAGLDATYRVRDHGPLCTTGRNQGNFLRVFGDQANARCARITIQLHRTVYHDPSSDPIGRLDMDSPNSKLNQRLDSYFEMLRSSLTARLKRRTSNWHLYAAVGGSAMAMATGLSAATVGTGARLFVPAPTRSSRTSRRHGLEADNIALRHPATLPMQFALALDQGTPSRRGVDAKDNANQAPPITEIGPNSGSVVRAGAIQAGQFVTIVGTNLAAQTASWNNDFPTSLGGTSVEIDGRPAYLLFVSPGMITLQMPDDTATGAVPVVVTTTQWDSVTSRVNFSHLTRLVNALHGNYVSGIILRSDGSGAFGGGSYDILSPDGDSFGYPTVAAVPGDMVELFGSRFGPTQSCHSRRAAVTAARHRSRVSSP